MIAATDDFKKTGPIASAVSQFVSDVTSIVSSLAGMAIISAVTDNETGKEVTPLQDVVQAGIYGAQNLALKANDLGIALGDMVTALASALGVVNLKSLTDMQPVFTALAEIATAISSVITALATITDEQLTAAANGGAALGDGFLAGLISREQAIYEAARRIVQGTADILGGQTSAGSGSVTPNQPSGPASPRRDADGGQTILNLNIDKVNASTAGQAKDSGQKIASAIITTLARAKQSTGRAG
jgi:hypothetical protein